MEFHGTPWKASSLENTPWNSMEIHVLILHGIPWKIFHRIPWNSMEFHGGILHGRMMASLVHVASKCIYHVTHFADTRNNFIGSHISHIA